MVQYAGRRAGLVVDQLFGEFQTVKPLGKVFSHIRCIGGSTILGSGEVALILMFRAGPAGDRAPTVTCLPPCRRPDPSTLTGESSATVSKKMLSPDPVRRLRDHPRHRGPDPDESGL